VQQAKALGLPANDLVQAQATDPLSLKGVMANTDLVISSLGITRQKDGLTYRDVDCQANLNLLQEALAAGVTRFSYIDVLGAPAMRHVPLVAAKQAFVDRLLVAPIASTIVAPSGYFSDMADFLSMARGGRIWLFGSGQNRMNPIHGTDLAVAVAGAVENEQDWLDDGGPDVFTHDQLAECAFAALGKPAKITYLPDFLRRIAIRLLPWVSPISIYGPAQFFLTATGLDMTGVPRGQRHLADHFAELSGD